MTTAFHHVIDVDNFPEDDRHVVMVNGWRVFITRNDGDYVAINDRCPHAGSVLSTGRMRRGYIMCPLHGARFELRSGRCAGGAYSDLRMFPLRIRDGRLEVRVPVDPPDAQERPVCGN